jgi:hypothetical protein
MVNMRSVQVLEGNTKAKVGSSHVLLTLYTGLEKLGLGTVGGRVADVGLGGFALGGGLVNWGPQYGLVVDNILEYEVSQMLVLYFTFHLPALADRARKFHDSENYRNFTFRSI